MTTFFCSDMHIGHKNIIKYCQRPWTDVTAMDEVLVANWNSVVKPGDTVWNLGDFAFTCAPAHASSVLRELNGKHHFIRGNHDELAKRLHAREWGGISPFVSWTDGYREIEVEGKIIVLCHYAMREWHHALQGTWHLFGHTHAGLGPYGKSVDVGVDNAFAILGVPQFTPESYRPISFAELKRYMDKLPPGPHPPFAGVPVKHRGLNAS
jgi:calcineurin-like phosphoesterase family protein